MSTRSSVARIRFLLDKKTQTHKTRLLRQRDWVSEMCRIGSRPVYGVSEVHRIRCLSHYIAKVLRIRRPCHWVAVEFRIGCGYGVSVTEISAVIQTTWHGGTFQKMAEGAGFEPAMY